MRYEQHSRDTGRQGWTVAVRIDAAPVLAEGDPSPVIEELGAMPVGSVGRPVDRRLGLVVGLIAAIVGFGFMTRDAHVATPRGGDNDRSSVQTVPSAAPTWTDVAVPTVVLAGSGITLGTTIAIGVIEDARGVPWLTVEASGMSSAAAGVLDIDAHTAAGELVGCGSAEVTVEDERSGSDGGARVTVGSVHARILIRRSESVGVLGVTIRWRDGRDSPSWPMSGPPGCRAAAR